MQENGKFVSIDPIEDILLFFFINIVYKKKLSNSGILFSSLNKTILFRQKKGAYL